MKIISTSELRKTLAKVMDTVTKTREIYMITRIGSEPVVIIGQQHYDDIEKQLNKQSKEL